MKKQKFAVWGSLAAAVLWALAGLRDTFAPGFFSMSGRKMTGGDIAVEFAIAAIFIVVARSFARRSLDKQHAKKNPS
jgi:hypothetical protein